MTRLTIPDPALVLLIGPSGGGKSTFARAHFAPVEVVSSDALRQLVSNDPADQTASAEAFKLLSLIVNGRLKRRLMTVIDATSLRATDRARYRQLAARYGIPVVAIALDLRAEVYAENNRRRPDRVVAAEVVVDQVARMGDVMADLPSEEYAALYVLRTVESLTLATIYRSK